MNLIIMSRYVICYREEWRRTTSLRNQNDNQSTVHRHRKELGTSQSPIYCMDATKGTGSENLVFLNLYFLQHLMSIKKQYTIHNYISHIRDVSNQSRCMSTIGITTSRRQKNIPATCRLPWDNDENIPSHPSIIIME